MTTTTPNPATLYGPLQAGDGLSSGGRNWLDHLTRGNPYQDTTDRANALQALQSFITRTEARLAKAAAKGRDTEAPRYDRDRACLTLARDLLHQVESVA